MIKNSIKVERYNSDSDYHVWNDFVISAEPKSFLFNRRFMDYHSNRFEDYSLLIYHDEQLIAVCPAHKKGQELLSHWGLTYGGLLLTTEVLPVTLESIYRSLLNYLIKYDFSSFKIKSIPDFYGKINHELNLKYLRTNAQSIRLDKVLAIDFNRPLKLHKTKVKHHRKNSLKGFELIEVKSFTSFWNEVLIPRLKDKHHVQPVHNLEEISLLKGKFPNQIRQFNLYFEERILAGITIFDKGSVVKSQYGATTDEGEQLRALEYLFIELIYKYKNEGKQFFSMGTVMDSKFEEGYNPGLLRQKQELGCDEYEQHFYNFDF